MPVHGQARAVDKVRVVHAELLGSLVHARDESLLAARQVLAERDGRVVAGDDAHGLDEVFDAHLLALFEPDLLPPIDAACALPVTVSSYESAPESMASMVKSSVITFVTLAGSRGVCSSLAKSTVPVCFSIKRAEGGVERELVGAHGHAQKQREQQDHREHSFHGGAPFFVWQRI